MVRPIVTIRPSQLLALNALDPLDEQEENSEDRDGEPYVGKVSHDASEPPPAGEMPDPCSAHTGSRQSLTRSMRIRPLTGK